MILSAAAYTRKYATHTMSDKTFARVWTSADLDWHTSTVESMGEQRPPTQQPLITRTKLDFGDRKRVPQVEGAVHVGIREVSKPLGVFLLDL